MADNIPKNIPNKAAAAMLQAERARVTKELMEVNRQINELAARQTQLEKRLREVTDGERVLAERSY